jgi:hypothetical protein
VDAPDPKKRRTNRGESRDENLRPFIASLVLAGALPVYAEMESAPAALGQAVLVEKTATVEDVDTANRLVTLNGPEGGMVTVQAGPEVKHYLKDLKEGDTVQLTFTGRPSLGRHWSGR